MALVEGNTMTKYDPLGLDPLVKAGRGKKETACRSREKRIGIEQLKG